MLSACLACYVMNDGWSTIYYGVTDYGLLWFVLQWPAIFIFQVRGAIRDHMTLFTLRAIYPDRTSIAK